MGSPEISIVVPVYNEEGNLAPLVRRIQAAVETLGRGWELLLVDDGSSDRSAQKLDALARRDSRIRVLRLSRNMGKSAALDIGFRRAKGSLIVTLDADLQNDPADIPRLLAVLAEADVAAGVRRRRLDPWPRRLGSRIGNGFRQLLVRNQLRDSACGLRAYRREALARLPMFHGMHRFFPTLANIAGLRVEEVEVEHHPRISGRAKYGMRNRLVQPALDLLAVRWMKKRWIHTPAVEEIRYESADPPAATGSR